MAYPACRRLGPISLCLHSANWQLTWARRPAVCPQLRSPRPAASRSRSPRKWHSASAPSSPSKGLPPVADSSSRCSTALLNAVQPALKYVVLRRQISMRWSVPQIKSGSGKSLSSLTLRWSWVRALRSSCPPCRRSYITLSAPLQ